MDQEGNRGQLDQPVSHAADEAARIREQIEHTRANLSGTIEELQDRLRPEHLVSQAGDAMRDAVEQKVKTMVNTASNTATRVAEQARSSAESLTYQVQSHPLPAALAVVPHHPDLRAGGGIVGCRAVVVVGPSPAVAGHEHLGTVRAGHHGGGVVVPGRATRERCSARSLTTRSPGGVRDHVATLAGRLHKTTSRSPTRLAVVAQSPDLLMGRRPRSRSRICCSNRPSCLRSRSPWIRPD